jgi:hypothetical protein
VTSFLLGACAVKYSNPSSENFVSDVTVPRGREHGSWDGVVQKAK